MNTPWEMPPLAEDPRDDDEREQDMLAANARAAARYRFLRQPGSAIIYAADSNAWGHKYPGHIRYDDPEVLDNAIDTAMGGVTPPQSANGANEARAGDKPVKTRDEIIGAVRSRIFSARHRFCLELEIEATLESGERLAWPGAVLYLTPEQWNAAYERASTQTETAPRWEKDHA